MRSSYIFGCETTYLEIIKGYFVTGVVIMFVFGLVVKPTARHGPLRKDLPFLIEKIPLGPLNRSDPKMHCHATEVKCYSNREICITS